ncbi:MAG: peptidoglycan recognition family protein [Saprospiraceae bacterium]|nr:peptidoglycan recognition family protein [Saprospiraceae bacterium]
MSSRYSRLPSMENNFFIQEAARLEPFDYNKDQERVQGYFYSPLTSQFYYSEAQTKKRIVLHFTAGNLQSDMRQLTQTNYHVSVSFVIARDGKIYQLFFSKYWSHHLGMTSGNPGKIYDKQSIGIELSNYGWLKPVGQDLETIYSRQLNSSGIPNPVDVYCNRNVAEAYTPLAAPYREQSFYASFTPAQMESLIVLVRYLCALYRIPPDFLSMDKRFLMSKPNMDFMGIVSHVNFRDSGKWDIGPALDWNTLIDGVQANRFVPVIHPIASTRSKLKTQSESEFIQGKTMGSKYNSRKKTTIRSYDPFDWEN